MSNIIGNHVGGSRVSLSGGTLQDVFNPSTGEVSGQVRLSSPKELDDVVKVASEAAVSWAATPAAKRAQVMYRFKRLLEENSEKVANSISSEHGKTHDDALGEVARGLEAVEFSCGIPHLLKGTFSEQVAASIDVYSIPQPLGVVAGITPFNFPAMVPMWMFPNALACGNAFILKPSERDPSVTLIIADLLKEAGLPEGVFSVVQGDKVVVDAILDNPEIKAVSFVGSTPVAEYIYTRGSGNGKRVQALGGAKNHMVIMPDADMDQVVDALMGAGYGSAGERCMAISVPVPVGEKVADELMDRMVPLVKKLPVGPPSDSSVAMGPVITKQSLERITALLQSGVDQGAKLLVDGRSLKVPGHENGFFIGASLFDQVTPEMEIYKEEIFGPVLSSVRVSDYEEAIKLIHNNQYANGVAIFTRDGDAARDFVNRIEVGMVGVNVPIPVPVGYHSFGGWKKSLFGSHHIYGPDTIHFYTRLKAVTSRWPTGIKAGAQFNFPTMS
ncbi:MAG: CoA-acylating methylmalonate-semialdehyde dehydrogenase [SAR324 cluster bacterium]|jgi:malonate-semialdehyde dehydrogenase (acetylating)/methylmalonate-semialdehyde dehydrogenase|nr:CoA-acylating methylmalonate-semialdehyde dehydrogenase [SAR324 cluster bacterium]MDP6331702.1 CoA-acylating methylmalonate-semialdehyde dehydrogenase [SAR324 cluster bacterium]HJL93610.1 CoA-acylating methylmalonate-semialdehyde dehydrogenase [SAR324 cluster bacterium]|tara:strand:+ start:22 stop:1521 length:1500 start_codon:yes stop_codon:yes gene_type:complete